jgi:beta-glucosidase
VTPTVPPRADVERRVDDLLATMTLAEKVGQMTLADRAAITPEEATRWAVGAVLSGGDSAPEPNDPATWRATVEAYQSAAAATRLRIPILYGVDAVHGAGTVRGATVFPHNSGLGATRDADLVERIGRATATELAALGIHWNFAPVVAVPHDIRWGRTYESFSEDPAIVTSLGVAALRGLQQTGNGPPLSASSDVIATPKHFVGDGGTEWGTSTTSDYSIDQGDNVLPEADLRARHLAPYEAMIDAGARSIMVSYSSWNGLKMHANGYLITDVLKGELGFDGFVVSDWAGIDQIPGDYTSDIVTAINAGVDMVMVPNDYVEFIDDLIAAVEVGAVSEDRIDDAARRILRVKVESGLLDERTGPNPDLLAHVGSASHRSLARRAVQASLVLLKDESATMPLDWHSPLVYVAGRGADDVGLQSGGWTVTGQGRSGAITPGTTILEGIEATVDPSTRVVFDAGGDFTDVVGERGEAARADVAIVVLAEDPYAEGPGDRADLRLPEADRELLARVRPLADRLVVVLLSGRPLVVTDEIGDWDAFVAAWLPGSEGGGVADVLFGNAPFTGRLPYTWPRTNEQLPIDPDAPLEPGCDGPLFPLGYAQTGPDPAPWLTCP